MHKRLALIAGLVALSAGGATVALTSGGNSRTTRPHLTIASLAKPSSPVGSGNATSCPAPTPTGTGTLTTANPGDNLTTKASTLTAGSVMVLNNGTYSPTVNSGTFGAWYINGINGTATNPIVIEAANDGGATITGDNETTQDVFYITNSSYVTICGLNFKDAPAGQAVFEVWGAAGNNVGDGTVTNITVERTTATNAPSGDVDCFKFGSNDLTINANVLFQDDAAMGPCRYGFANHHVNGVTDRRDWAYNMGVVNFANAPRSGYNAYGSKNVTIENSIAQNIPSTVDNNPYTGIYQTSNDPNLFPEQNAHYYGDILYNVCEGLHATGNSGSGTIMQDTYISVPANSTCATNQGANYNPNGITWANPTTMTATNDVINNSDDGVQMQPGSGAITFLNSALVNNNNAINNTSGTANHTFSDFNGNTTNFATTPGNGGTLSASDLTASPGYQPANGLGTYLSPAPSLLGQGSGGADIGAHITNEYVNGTLTGTPLWPWPMESRIQTFAGVSVTNSFFPPAGGGGGGHCTTSCAALLKWSGVSTPNLTGYLVSLDGTQNADVTTPDTSYLFAGLSCATDYTFTVQPHDDIGNTGPAYNSGYTTPSCTATPPPPANTGLPTISDTAPVVGEAITVTTGSWTGSPTSYDYVWEDCDSAGANCAPAPNAADSSAYTVSSTDAGSTLRVIVKATNIGGTGTATTAATAVVTNSLTKPGNTGLPVISDTSPTSGETISTTNGTWTGDLPMTFTYTWQDCSATCGPAANPNNTSQSYVVQAGDVGQQLRVLVNASNDATVGTAGVTAFSNKTAAVTSSSPGTCAAPSHTLHVVNFANATGSNANKVMFGPWTNHVVTTTNGDIYIGYLATGSGSDVLGKFALARSTNAGVSFQNVYTATTTNWHHVDIETDGTNVYAVVNFQNTAEATNFDGYLFKFVPGSLASPTQTKFTGAASSKFSAIYNPVYNQIDVGFWSAFPGNQANFYAVNLSGTVAKSLQLFNSGPDNNGIVMQYPNLALDPAGDIFFGYHTVDNNKQNTVQNYYDDEFIYSTDNGTTWKGPGGTLTLPENPTPSGNNYEITNTNDSTEFIAQSAPGYSTNHDWNVMDSIAYNNGALNFMYGGDAPQNHVSYAHLAWPGTTFSHRTHAWTSTNGTVLKDGENSLGAFSQDPTHTGNLYFVGADTTGPSPVVFESNDSGTTWCDYTTNAASISPMTYEGAARFIDTVNGQVQGVFSSTTNSTQAALYFVYAAAQ